MTKHTCYSLPLMVAVNSLDVSFFMCLSHETTVGVITGKETWLLTSKVFTKQTFKLVKKVEEVLLKKVFWNIYARTKKFLVRMVRGKRVEKHCSSRNNNKNIIIPYTVVIAFLKQIPLVPLENWCHDKFIYTARIDIELLKNKAALS